MIDHSNKRLLQQVTFILEIDKLKKVLRRTYLVDGSRNENTAEHSWHLAVMALILSEHANETVDVMRVMKMVLIHDIVEIDAGDTFAYDDAGNASKLEREQEAADRLFNLLPQDQAQEIRALWDEFEARETMEAKFANAMDRMIPLLHNYTTEGKAWIEHDVNIDMVKERTQSTFEDASAEIWSFMEAILDDAVAKGYVLPSENTKDKD